MTISRLIAYRFGRVLVGWLAHAVVARLFLLVLRPVLAFRAIGEKIYESSLTVHGFFTILVIVIDSSGSE